MAHLDFPLDPVDGQQYPAPNGVTYVWFADPGLWLDIRSLEAATGTGAFVLQNSPELAGNPTTTTPAPGDNSDNIANTEWVNDAIFEGTRAGFTTLVAGTKTVNNSTLTPSTNIFLSRKVIGGAVGNLSYTIIPGVSFTITSTSGTDTSTISWLLAEA